MLSTGTNVICRDSLGEILIKRERSLELYEKGFALIHKAIKLHKDSAKARFGPEYDFENARVWSDLGSGHFKEPLKIARTRLDKDIWVYLRDGFGLKNIMDAEAFKEFNKQLDEAPPEVNKETVMATFTQLNDDKEKIFKRGLVNVFSKLCKKYKTNDAFKVGSRVILSGALSSWGWNHWSDGQEQISDLDRIFHILDGKPHKDHLGDAAALLFEARKVHRQTSLETAYFAFKWYKNGNVHIAFKRAELVDDANIIIAEHFGEVLANVR